MKLDHDVVKDLYPLYIENELSLAVKKAVDEHLSTCVQCKGIYESGEGFTEQLREMEEPDVPKNVDDNIHLRIKLNRLKWVSLLLVGIILTMLITDYKNDREKLFMALQDYYGTQRHLPDTLGIIKNKEYSDLENIREVVHQFFEDRITLEEHMNILEKRALRNTEYSLAFDTSTFNKMLEVMQLRFDQDRWSETDEAAYQKVEKYFDDLNTVVEEEYTEMHHGYSSYLETLNVKEMDEFYKKINVLSVSYTKYHKLPEQVQLLAENELKQKVGAALDIVNLEKIQLEKESPINYGPYIYRFKVSGKEEFHGQIDPVSGQILEIHGVSGELTNGPLMNKEEAEKLVMGYMEKIYGSKENLDLISLGTNYHISANDPRFKMYSYKIVPIIKDYKLYTPFDNGTIIHIDARTGELNSFSHNPYVPSFSRIKDTNLSIKVTRDELKEESGNFNETVIIYSATSGGFELVHMDTSAEDFQEGKFYSAQSGKEEWIYFDER